MKGQNWEQKLLENILKSKGAINKRQLPRWRTTTSIQNIIKVKYPDFIIKSMTHENTIIQFLAELETICQSYCQDRSKRKEFFLKKVCQHFFSSEEKILIFEMLGQQFQQEKQNYCNQNLGAKQLFQLLQFIFNLGDNQQNQHD